MSSMLLNIIPTLGLIIATIILGIGMIRKKNTLIRIAQITFIVLGLVAIPAELTNEETKENTVSSAQKDQAPVQDQIDEADITLYFSLGLVVMSILSILIQKRPELVMSALLSLAVITCYTAINSGKIDPLFKVIEQQKE